MIKHQETHPYLDVEGCFGCKVSAVGFSAELMPTRSGSSRSASVIQQERVLDKDLDAYKRLRQDGIQPKKIDGAANVEARAQEKWQAESGILPDF
jgi:hypothetical protein